MLLHLGEFVFLCCVTNSSRAIFAEMFRVLFQRWLGKSTCDLYSTSIHQRLPCAYLKKLLLN